MTGEPENIRVGDSSPNEERILANGEDSLPMSPLSESGSLDSLASAKQEHSYRIVSNNASGRNRMHMDSLGLIPGDIVHVLFSNFAGLVVAVKGSRLALGRPLAACLTVQELKDSDWQPDVQA